MASKKKYIVALDQGTTTSRAMILDKKTQVKGFTQRELRQFTESDHVEQDPREIWQTQWYTFTSLLDQTGVNPDEIDSIGITNQRETTLLWDKSTGEPIHNAIVWLDKRTTLICEEIKKNPELEEHIRKTTGLRVSTYFSATKIKWILENVPGAREKAEKGQLLFGTVDTWLIWNLTNKRVHATDYSNASRTMLFDITQLCWDEGLLSVLNIPKSILPEVRPSAGDFGQFEYRGVSIPIRGVAGDQQAALFGQLCFEPGMVKNTYGTGCFTLMNTGERPYISNTGLLTTIAWGIGKQVCYAVEGSIFVAGAAIQWLRDSLKLIDSTPDSEYFANKAYQQSQNPGVYVVPAFTGLGAPYWDMYARGAIFGLSLETTKNEIILATLQSLAYQTKDVLLAMEKDSGLKIKLLRADGGASENKFLMQFQADILGVTVEKPENVQSTAVGAAFLAGISSGFWTFKDIENAVSPHQRFNPSMSPQLRKELYSGWKKAVSQTTGWLK